MPENIQDARGTPLWVKVQGALVALLILLVIAMSGGFIHGGPGGHGSAPEAEDSTVHETPGGGH